MSFEEQVDSAPIDTPEATESTENVANESTENKEADLSYEKGVKLSEKLQKNPDLEDIVDLGKLPKFKWNGKTLTAKELQSMAMMQSDYTKKTQEISQTKKYYENLYYDLNNVKNNPALVAEFKRIYPKQFHAYLDSVMSEVSQKPVAPLQEPAKQSSPEKEAAVDPRLEEMYNFYKEQRQQSSQEKVDALFDRLSSKYTDADEAKVIARVQTLIELSKREPDKYQRPDEAAIEKLFKQEHEAFQTKLKEQVNRVLDEQRKANARGRGPASGGAIPGTAPKLPKTIKEATALALQDPNF